MGPLPLGLSETSVWVYRRPAIIFLVANSDVATWLFFLVAITLIPTFIANDAIGSFIVGYRLTNGTIKSSGEMMDTRVKLSINRDKRQTFNFDLRRSMILGL